VEVLRGLAHHGGALVDQALGDEARVEVDVLAHRVVAHVLHAPGDCEVAGAHRDLARRGGHGREGARAHTVDGEPGDGVGEAREQRHVTAQRQSLIADLRRGGHGDVADPLGWGTGIATQKLANGLDGHVVRAGLPEETALAGAAERRPDAVDVDDLSQLARHAAEDTRAFD
jgi:hypothetical protein